MPPRPIVAVNTLAVNPSNEGTRTMLTRLLPALAQVDPDLDLLLVCSPHNRALFPADAQVLELPVGKDRTLRRIVADQVQVPWAVRHRADVLVTPTSTGPLWCPIPHVAIVAAHLPLPSCQAAAGPDGLGLAHRLYYGWPFRQYLRNADTVLTISEFLADGVVEELGIDAGKVTAMPLGVDLPAGPVPGIDGRPPVALFVGTLYGYKDALTAVRAFAAARPQLPDGSRLVIVGKDPYGKGPELLRAARDGGVANEVELTGAVDDAELEGWYRRASVLLMPSRCEGFGLPVAEAMARNCPVVIANATSLPGVAGDAGIAVAPGDVQGFADALVRVLGQPELRRDLAARGMRRAEALSWTAAAALLAGAIRSVLPEPAHRG